ncbi:MAG: AAA family ATPase, partial [Lachnospiraceae bacterium]|nr:AAA family ATPase [Lachnospiraceae bacterium]
TFSHSKRKAVYRDIRLKCMLFGYLIYLYHLPESVEDEAGIAKEILASLSDASLPGILGADHGLPPRVGAAAGIRIRKLDIPHPKANEQRLLWQDLAENAGLSFPSKDTTGELVSKYTLNPGRIADALFAVKLMMPRENDGVLDIPLLEEQIRRLSAADFGDTATKLSSPFTFDDLIVGAKSRRLLELAVSRIRHTSTINDTYGFGRKLPYGRGVAIVLYGPPGTGKTMAAQVIAKELNLDIYRVDLSQISSKYIGETEKNLGTVFDAAKNSNAILFFDEADALFSKRTNVSTSNDKHANAETAYLLQKVEEYEGVSILATNNMNNFDAAFKRRMTFLIPVEAPDEVTRKSLWEAVFPEGAPVDPMVDFALLARTFELTGAQIKSIAITSAYLAADIGSPIGYEQLIEAADMECAKAGQLNAGDLLRSAIFSEI